MHTLGGVGWEPPPRGPHWDLLVQTMILADAKCSQLIFISVK